MYWLNGSAGTGKSTISQTFAQYCFAEGLLGASFFCSRDIQDRSNIQLIFPTLAFDLAYRNAAFRAALLPILASTPNIGHESLSTQLSVLLIEPLMRTGISVVILIDALDECRDSEPESIILSLLAHHIDKIPNVMFFITGRPESRMRSAFRLPLLSPHTKVLLLNELDREVVDRDIGIYLESRLSGIMVNRSDVDISTPWPSSEDIAVACQRCAGLFIYAFTTVEFLKSPHHDPRERLELITRIPSDTSHEGRKGVDMLYTQVLDDAVGQEDASFFVRLRLIMSTVVMLYNPLNRGSVAALLGINATNILSVLRSLHSVLHVPQPISEPIRVFHKSFSDFLTDRNRCISTKYYLKPSIYHAELAVRSLHLMNVGLKTNICLLPRYAMNNDVADLSQRRQEYIGDALQYACVFWAKHLEAGSVEENHSQQIIPLLLEFFHHRLLAWLEVLSVSGELHSAVHSLHHVKVWLLRVSSVPNAYNCVINAVIRCSLLTRTYWILSTIVNVSYCALPNPSEILLRIYMILR